MLDCHSFKGNYICNNTQPKAVFILLKVLILRFLSLFFLFLFELGTVICGHERDVWGNWKKCALKIEEVLNK
jgi:hypothetical protein